ncbi:DUF2213 domain-containing protein, partial [Aeromonas sanarellii]|uniref:DUF2213 domain-containing protein n=1 Tax=Aeromonas sanarellii TaxID=633415 RepID=UPI0039A079E1
STGYDSTPIAETGTYNGEPYQARQTITSTDHVALLPDEPGNCSIADGCGVGRVNTDSETKPRLNAQRVSNVTETTTASDEPDLSAVK